MKRPYLLITLMIGAAMIFTGCSGGASPDQAKEFPEGTGSGEVFTDTEDITTTENISPSVEISPSTELSPTVASEPATAEPTVATTEEVTTTEELPSTGMLDAGLVTSLLDFGVFDQKGAELGETQDLVVDITTGEITYLVVEVEGNLIPVPWELVTVIAATADTESTATGPQNDFVLAVDQEVVAGAPNFAEGEFPDTQALDWDMEIQAYWMKFIPVGVQ